MKIIISTILLIMCLFTSLSIGDETGLLTDYRIEARHQVQMAFEREAKCMSENIIFEAGNQTIRGKIAVAQVTLNRLESGKFSNTLCKIIYEPHQYSWTMLVKKPKYAIMDYEQAYIIAINVMLHKVSLPELKDALYYHANYVSPRWKHDMIQVAQIEQHIFYKTPRMINEPTATRIHQLTRIQ